MGRTIIQPIGPLYGEAVNGTVFGRPNGSIYIPETNQIAFYGTFEYVKNRIGWGTSPYYIIPTSSDGSSDSIAYEAVARSQDTAAYMVMEISDNSAFAGEGVKLASRTYAAGMFNSGTNAVLANSGQFEIEDGVTYYVRARLVAASGVDVAVSDTIEVTGVA